MILFHGSNTSIETIDLEKSNPFKDFGRAFYLSADEQQAKEMAKFKSLTEGGEACVTAFEIEDDILGAPTELSVLSFDEYSREWAEFVFANRKRTVPAYIHNYDVVFGPIANDRVGAQIVRYQEGDITFDEFLQRLKYMKGITFQYAFCTSKAIEFLKKI